MVDAHADGVAHNGLVEFPDLVARDVDRMAVVDLDLGDLAELAVGNPCAELLFERIEVEDVVDEGFQVRVGFREFDFRAVIFKDGGGGFLAEHMLARFHGRDGLRAVEAVGADQPDGVNVGVVDDLFVLFDQQIL